MDNAQRYENISENNASASGTGSFEPEYSGVMYGNEAAIVRLNIKLLQNCIVYRDNNPEMWEQVLWYRDIIEKDMNRIGATLVINQQDGHPHAYVTNIPVAQEDGNKLPKLFPIQSLSLRRSWIVTYLRKMYMEYEKSSQEKCFIDFDDMVSALRVCWKTDKNDELGFRKQLESDLNFFERICKVVSKSTYETGKYQVLPGIKIVFRMQDFTDFDAKLSEYGKRMSVDFDEISDKENTNVAE